MTARGGHRGRALLIAAAVLIAGLFSGCAYYNTFYYARKYYAQAEKTQEQSQSDKLSPDAVRKYEDAIKQCNKVLTMHQGSRWADDAVYLMGACFYGKREYESALKKFDELMANFPRSSLVPWAEYMSGLCHYQRRDYEQMDASFRKVFEAKPEFEKRDEILFTQARAAEGRRDRALAIRRYRELGRAFRGSPRGEEALVRIGDLYMEAGAPDSAYAAYDELIGTAHDDKTANEARLKAGDALVRTGQSAEAVRMLRRLVPPENSDASLMAQDEWPARVRLHLAQAQNVDGDHPAALRTLRDVTEKFPTSTSAAEAQFQIGYTYEVYLDSLGAARTAYDQVGKLSGRSVFREQAATRSRNLEQLQRLSRQAAPDSASSDDKLAEASFKIAELYLLSQNKVDEALRKYREVQEKYPDSRLAPRAAYAVGWIHLKSKEGTRDSALTELTQVVRRYPASRQARGALDLLVAERADTSGLRALLVEMKPDTTPAVRDSVPADTIAGPANRIDAAPGSAPADSGRGFRPGMPGGPPDGRPESEEDRLLRDRRPFDREDYRNPAYPGGDSLRPPFGRGDSLRPPFVRGDSLRPPFGRGDSLRPPFVRGDSLRPPSVPGDSLRPPFVPGDSLGPPQGTDSLGAPIAPLSGPRAGGPAPVQVDSTRAARADSGAAVPGAAVPGAAVPDSSSGLRTGAGPDSAGPAETQYPGRSTHP